MLGVQMTDRDNTDYSANVNSTHGASYYKAPPGWDSGQPNPFTPDGAYGSEWSAFEICDRDDDRRVYGRSPSGLLRHTNGRRVEDLEMRLADFLRYENANGRKTIVACPADVDIDSLVAGALEDTPEGAIIRKDDSRWAVHSATLGTWELIGESGCLKSFARLKAEGVPAHGIGFGQFGEPDDFAEHVMLGEFDGIGCENVVASQAKGQVFTEEHTPYTPGVRLYFDAHRIITAGLAVRDGVHTLKVHDRLPLQPYLVAAATVADIDPQGMVETWTPRRFLERANAWFEEQAGSDSGTA